MTGKEAKERLSKKYKRQNDYIKEKYDRVSVVLPDKTKERIKELTGKSCNAYISALVLADLDRLENCGAVKQLPESNKPKLTENELYENIAKMQVLLDEKRAENDLFKSKQAQEEEPKETEEEKIERLKHDQVILEEIKAKNGIVEQPKEFIREQSKNMASVEDEPPF